MNILAIASSLVLVALVVHSALALPKRRAAAFWVAVLGYGVVRGIGVRLVTERGLDASFPYAFHEQGPAIFGIGAQELAGWALVAYLAWWLGSRVSPARLFPGILVACGFLAAASFAVETAAAAAGWWFWNLPAGSKILGPVPSIAIVDWAFVGIDFLLPFVVWTSPGVPTRLRLATLVAFPLHFVAHLFPSILGVAHGGLVLAVLAAALFSRAESGVFADEPPSVGWIPPVAIVVVATVCGRAALEGGGGPHALLGPAILGATALLGRQRGTFRLDMPKRRAWAVLAAAGIAMAALGAASARGDARLKAGLAAAVAARDRGDLRSAIRTLEDLEDTGSHVSHAMLGEIHYRTGALADARREFERAVEIQPSFVRGHRFLAVIALRQGDPAGAVARARRGLAVSPDDLELAYLAGSNVLERALSAGPQAASNIVALAYEVADVPTARVVADRALSLWPDDPRLAVQRRRLDR
ncbi:MAG TPA: tetratricopeptide repeat protein [Candidatus Polarisedimenticolaceae bacterium]|nr:tetratricopeptide repeat protein [Candidatus Polarisedimenticolaceae bacterium]